MKKAISVLLTIIVTASVFVSCSKDEEESRFNYPMSTLYGTWETTHMQLESGGTWIDLSDWFYSDYKASITFKSDGTYYGRGYLGNGSGTYKASGNVINTYVSGELYMTYTIKTVNGKTMEGKMSQGGSYVNFKAKKQ